MIRIDTDQPATNLVSSIYTDGQYLSNNPDWHSEDAPYKSKWILDILAKNKLRPQSVCEVGCGAGDLIVHMSKAMPAAKFDGYDISPQAYALAKPKSTPVINFHLADFTAESRDKFDLLMAIDVFEHIPNYLDFLTQIRGKSEYTLFHIPLDMSVQMILRRGLFKHIRKSLGHLHYFCSETAIGTLNDCGYEILDWNYTYWSLDYPALSWKSKIGRIPRRMLNAVSADLSARILGGASMMVLAAEGKLNGRK